MDKALLNGADAFSHHRHYSGRTIGILLTACCHLPPLFCRFPDGQQSQLEFPGGFIVTGVDAPVESPQTLAGRTSV